MDEFVDPVTGEVVKKITGPNVFQRVLAIMADLPGVAKTGTVDFGRTKYDYQKMEDIVSAIHPLQVKHGIAILPDVQKEHKEGNLTKAHVLVTFINTDDPEDRFTTQSVGYGTDSGDKGMAKAYTAALKACYIRTFALGAEVEPDAENVDDTTQKISDEDANAIIDITEALAQTSAVADAQEIQEELCKKAGVGSILELPPDGLARTKAFIERKYSTTRKK